MLIASNDFIKKLVSCFLVAAFMPLQAFAAGTVNVLATKSMNVALVQIAREYARTSGVIVNTSFTTPKQQQQQIQAAQAFTEAMGGGGTGQGGPEGQVQPGADQMAPQGQNQVMDESMPGAKGMIQ